MRGLILRTQLLEGSFEEDKGSLIEALRKVRVLGSQRRFDAFRTIEERAACI